MIIKTPFLLLRGGVFVVLGMAKHQEDIGRRLSRCCDSLISVLRIAVMRVTDNIPWVMISKSV